MAIASSKLYILRDVDGVATKFPSETLPLVLTTYTYSAQRMGSAPTLEATVFCDRCLDKEWTKEEYIEFNGERFYVDRIPSSTKDTSSHLYKHEITLTSRRQILDNTLFFDAVSDSDTDTSGDDAYRSNMTSFTFGGTIEEFVARVNSSLIYCNLYDTSTQSGYKVVIDDGYATDDVQEISFEDKYITEVLQEVYNTYGLNYYWVGKTCHIGDIEQEIENTIQYGTSNALSSVNKENSNNQIVDMATGYGSSDNIPYYYPNSDQYGTAVFETKNCEKSDVFSVDLGTVIKWNETPYNDTLKLIKYNTDKYTVDTGIGGVGTAAPTIVTKDSTGWTVVESNLESMANGSGKYQYTGGVSEFLQSTTITQNDINGLKFCATIGLNPYWITSIPNNIYDEYRGVQPKYITVRKFVKISNAKRFTEKVDFSSWIEPKITIKRILATSGEGKNLSVSDVTSQALADGFSTVSILSCIRTYTTNRGTPDGSWGYWSYFPTSSYNHRLYYNAREGYQKGVFDAPWKIWNKLSNTYYAFDENEDEIWLEFQFEIYTSNIYYDSEGNYVTGPQNRFALVFAEIEVEFTEGILRVFEPGKTGYNILSDSGKSSKYAESGITFIDVDKMPAAEYSYTFNDSTNTWDLTVSGTDEAAKIYITGREWIYPTSKLMPSIYRTSAGKERFLYALDNTHLLPGSTSEYYAFENQYTKGNPHQGVETFDDIKPTIKDMKNASGDLIGEVLDVAYDENDSDLTTTNGNSSEEYLHPYFYIKLHRFDGENGFDLFKHALESDTAKVEMTVSQGCPACAFEIQKGTLDAGTNSFFNPVKTDSDGNIVSGDYDSKIVSSYTNISENNQNSVTNEIWIAVKKDNSTLGVVMPNVAGNFKVKKGDKFVITGIKMPTAYVLAAEKRLDAAIAKWMSENNSEGFNYSIKFSRIFLAQHPSFAKKLNENVCLHINYNGVEHILYVSNYTLKADTGILQEVSVELTKELGTNSTDAQNIANSITDLHKGNNATFSSEAADKRYLRKNIADTAQELINFKSGITIGDLFSFSTSGNIIARTLTSPNFSKIATSDNHLDKKGYTVAVKDATNGTYKLLIDELRAWSKTITGQLVVLNGASSETFTPGFLTGKGWGITSREVTNAAGATETKWTGEFDELVVRGSMKVYEMVISQLVGENDNRVFTGMMEVSYYDADSGKVYFSLDNGTSYNPFRTGDYIMVQQFSPSGYDVTKSYELIVTGYGNESINNVQYAWVTFDSFTTDIADGTAESLITEGDTFVRVDSISDPDRKGIVQIITVGTSTPHIDVIHGMKTDSDNSLKVRLGNLEKVTDTNFGTLEGFGLYSNNCYLSGDFVISKTGENVASKFEVLGDKFASQYTSLEDEMTKGDNLLTNGNFMPDSTGQPDVWECSDSNAVSIKSVDDRKALAFTTSNGKTVSLQLSSGNISAAPTHKVYNDDGSVTEEANDVTLAIKFKGSGINSLTVEYGTTTDGSTRFDAFANKGTADMDGWYTASTTVKCLDKLIPVSIYFSGAGYLEYIRMIPDTASGMQTEFDSAITQTSKAIALQATELSSTNSKVAEMQVTADGIKSTVSNLSSGTNCNLFGLTKGITFSSSGKMYFYAQAYGIVCQGATEYTLSGLGFRGAGGNFVVTCEVCAGQAMILGASLNGTTPTEGDATIPAETWTAVKFSFTGVATSEDSDKMVITTNETAMLSVRHLCIERGTMPAAQWSLSPIDLATCGSSYRKCTFTSAGTSAQDVVNGETTTVYMATKGAQDTYIDVLHVSRVAPVTTDSDGSMYTLSFWAKADEKGMTIDSHLYGNDNNPNVGYAYTDYLDNGGKQTVMNQADGYTRIYLTTEWRKYYVHWRTLNGEEFHIIPVRFVEAENTDFADGSQVYIAGVTFEAGYICEENGGAAASYSKIEQTADKISLSVDDAKTSAENYASELNNKTTTSLKSTGIDIEQGTISMYTDKFALKNRSTNKTVLEADSNGNLSLTGKVSADSGNIGDFEIQNNSLYAAPTASNSWESVQIDGKGIQLDRRQSSATGSVVEYMHMKQESYGYCLTYSDSTLNADVTFGRYDGGDSSFGIMAERVTTENSIEVRKSVGIGTDGFAIATKNTSSTYGTLNYSVSGKVAVQGFSGILCEIGAYISKIGYDTKNKWSVLVLNDLPNYEDKDKLENGQVYIASDGTLRVK